MLNGLGVLHGSWLKSELSFLRIFFFNVREDKKFVPRLSYIDNLQKIVLQTKVFVNLLQCFQN